MARQQKMESIKPGHDELKLIYARNSQIVSASLGIDEMALLSVARGKYYGLNGPATRIWEILDKPRTASEVCRALLAEFDVDPEICRLDTRDLLEELVAEGLVQVVPNGA